MKSKKRFLALWDERTYYNAGHKKVKLSYFTEDNGYNKFDIRSIHNLKVNRLFRVEKDHIIMRIK